MDEHAATTTTHTAAPSAAAPAFIERQLPVSKLSKESYKERRASGGQTLTALGKWWGRKPLVLVRAIILGLLLPATDNPEADRETFLALMTMDDDGMLRRLDAMPAAKVYSMLTPREQAEYFTTDGGKPAWRRETGKMDRKSVTHRAFLRMGYDERLQYCKRPEEIDGPSPEAWSRINAHLDTHAATLPELVAELGARRFGGAPRVGDVFSGGGSIPFEAARLGCDAYGSDLNPVAALLTWGALNIVGGGEAVVAHISEVQRRIFDAVQAQVDAWGIERNEHGWIADAYLYCADALDPATDWRVPLAPSWVIAIKPNVVARLSPDHERKRFDIEIIQDATAAEIAAAANDVTWSDGLRCPVDRDGHWLPPAQRQTTSAERLRGVNGLRLWENDDLTPRPDDVIGERLYCVRWYDPATKQRYYRAPTEDDLRREQRVLTLLRDRFAAWQASGALPSRRIEPGYNNSQPIRERGWTHWHHLFNPRQLLLAGLLAERITTEDELTGKALLLLLGRVLNWNSRLCGWVVGGGGKVIGGGAQTFYNQALNTLMNYSCRPLTMLESAFLVNLPPVPVQGHHTVLPRDARAIEWTADVWITDPGYGDVILYDEISEFFLAWYDKQLLTHFPGWYSDSKRALSVKGEGANFRVILAECYRRTAQYMRDDGFQVVMFTHQDPEVWADLTLVLWVAGLQVASAWTIATETSSAGIKQGNYVQGTVILVVRKRKGNERGYRSDIFSDVQREVRDQVRRMQALDPKEDPNFGDIDYNLAAYAAAMRVLTSYRTIDDMDPEQELRRERRRGETSPVAELIERAKRIASDELVPSGLESSLWRKLGPEERLYLKGVAVEASGDSREGVYQQLARDYGANDYRQLLANRTANNTRLKTPTEFAARDLRTPPLQGAGFAASLLRHTLYAIYTVAKDSEQGPQAARLYLRQELPSYWDSRATIIGLLRYLYATAGALPHWQTDAKATQLLLGAVENDAV